MERQAWPESGDLGLSIVWTHHHEDDRITRLTWSEDAHEWNPRWYGVVRRVQPGATGGELPYMVRIK
jgi:hypothetical protein